MSKNTNTMTTATFVKYQLANIYHVKSKKELTDEQRKELEEKVAKFKESLNTPKTEEPKTEETAASDSTEEPKTEETATSETEETAQTDSTEEPKKELYTCINYEDAKYKLATMHLFNLIRKLVNDCTIAIDWKKPKITVKRNNRLIARINVRAKSYYLRTYHDSIETVTKNATLEQIKKAVK